MALARQLLGRLTQVPRMTSTRCLSSSQPVMDKVTSELLQTLSNNFVSGHSHRAAVG